MKEAYAFEKAIKQVGKHVRTVCCNSWIEYVMTRSMLSYEEAYEFYDICCSLPHKFTRKKAKELSALVIDLANRGYGNRTIEVIMIALEKEIKPLDTGSPVIEDAIPVEAPGYCCEEFKKSAEESEFGDIVLAYRINHHSELGEECYLLCPYCGAELEASFEGGND